MCGIFGLFSTNLRPEIADVRDNCQTLSHRGPDDHGAWVSPTQPIALGHRRLSIVDLSPTGHQPMHSHSGRYVITFNGEIYNYKLLRRELAQLGRGFTGSSDTEVLLAAFEEWGVPQTLERLVGMFAFGLWDEQEKELWLARDRLGEKPLYYGWHDRRFVFCSELKALFACSKTPPEIDRDSLALFMRWCCVPAPYSIFKSFYKLMPASYLRLTLDDLRHQASDFSPFADANSSRVKPVRYWSNSTIAIAGQANPQFQSEAAAIAGLEQVLSNAVELQMVADVPVGAFLSGGIDSSAVVALMQKHASQPVRTFSIGFGENRFNEAHHAKVVANVLGTDHTELYVTPEDALAVIPLLPAIYDEPFSDSSQIPTYLVSKLARSKVTVALSGDGGDELFGGYERYQTAAKLWKYFSLLPPALRKPLGKAMAALPCGFVDKFLDRLPGAQKQFPILNNFSNRFRRVSIALTCNIVEELYGMLLAHWEDLKTVVIGAKVPETHFAESAVNGHSRDLIQKLMLIDLNTYLPDDILAKVDRAAMAVSLESRAPLLDHRVVEFAFAVPENLRASGGSTKSLLRQVLYKSVPKQLVDRPKMGFGVPIEVWLRGPLLDWAQSLLSEDKLKREGFLSPAPIREALNDHCSRKRNRHYELWNALMFQAWRDEYF